jgi:GNAT superfamily N-acetyltransferase
MTIYELPSALFHRCKPLYAQAPFDQPAYDAVFEGVQPGRIFVDDADAPTAALMCRTYEYYVAGTPVPAMRTFIKDAPEEAGVFKHLYGYTPVGEAWVSALLEDAPLEVIGRLNFQWDMGKPAPAAPVPDRARVVPIDLKLAEMVDVALGIPFLQLSWNDRQLFVERGFGYCALQGDELASAIYAIAMSSTGVIVGIDTIEKFQRQGYGSAVSAAFIREALRRGIQPIWDTDDGNFRSAAMAQKLGFDEHEPYKELYPPERKPQMSNGLWSRGATRADGVIEWVRR